MEMDIQTQPNHHRRHAVTRNPNTLKAMIDSLRISHDTAVRLHHECLNDAKAHAAHANQLATQLRRLQTELHNLKTP
jgi:hypothetical protein